MGIKDLPTDARPREKLLTRGPQALSDVELWPSCCERA